MTTVTNAETATSASRSRRSAWLKQVRQLHLYLGVFFAPAILFFAFSGSLQLFSLHEGHPGESYQPPKWIEELASIHKDQRIAEHHGPSPSFAAAQESRARQVWNETIAKKFLLKFRTTPIAPFAQRIATRSAPNTLR